MPHIHTDQIEPEQWGGQTNQREGGNTEHFPLTQIFFFFIPLLLLYFCSVLSVSLVCIKIIERVFILYEYTQKHCSNYSTRRFLELLYACFVESYNYHDSKPFLPLRGTLQWNYIHHLEFTVAIKK